MKPEISLPTTVDAEKAYIGSIILLGECGEVDELNAILPLVKPRHFSQENLGTIKAAVDWLFRNGKGIDGLTIVDRLRSAGQYEAVGGAATMADAGMKVPTALHARYYAEIITAAAQTRRLHGALLDSAHDIIAGKKTARVVISELHGELDEFQQEVNPGGTSSEEIFNRWARGIVDRQPQQVFECGPYGSEISKFSIGPETVTMIGAPPAAGKTAFCGQVVFDAIRFEGQKHLRLLIANVEMTVGALLTRQLARTSGVSYSYLHHRDYDESANTRIQVAIDELRSLMPRVEFMKPPFTLENLRRRVDAFAPDIVLLDYAQRFTSEAKQSDSRIQTNATMDVCRMIAEQGRAVIVVSAVSRQKSTSGSTYDSKSLGLASFRESSELEYGSDSAWILLREGDSDRAELRQVKNRTGKLQSLHLLFDGSRQQFRDDPQSTEWDR